MGRRKKMTAEEGLKILEQREKVTGHLMTRMQNQMSVKAASRFRRILRERVRKATKLSEQALASQMRRNGAKKSRTASGTHQGRQRYTLLDAAILIPINAKSNVLPALHRYPDGRVYLDLRIWGTYHDDEGVTEKLIPTKKGLTVPFEKVDQRMSRIEALWRGWKNRLLDEEGTLR